MKFQAFLLGMGFMVCACGQIEDGDPSTAVKSTEDEGLQGYYDDPARVDENYERHFDRLALIGAATKIPWTDSYWPKNKGGIAYRWLTNESHNYQEIPYEDALNLSEEEVGRLSPAEKYDLFVGNREYALTFRIKGENRPTTPAWQGYCHGWTAASIAFEEPTPILVTNPDGLRIPFGSSDIKALLTYLQGEIVTSNHWGKETIPFLQNTRSVGATCLSDDPNDPSCIDTHPAAFHIIMANEIGRKGRAFGIDATTTREKWNHPVHTYRTTVLNRYAPSSDANADTVEVVLVETEVFYTTEIEPYWEATTGTANHADKSATYTYALELNRDGEIIDGEWVTMWDGQPITLSHWIAWLSEIDENNDGILDYSWDQVKALTWDNFQFPDYVWLQDAAEFSPTFRMPVSKYELMANTVSTREKLYQYMSQLEDLYVWSTGQ